MSGLPIRDDLRDEEPYGAPQLAVPVILNVNENPYPPSESLVADVAVAVADVARALNRYPDREATQLRADLARYLEHESGVTVETRQVWAANGSNEIMQQILQAFGGPGRVAMSFSPTYSMYPEYARNTNTGYVAVPRAEDFSIDRAAALEAIATHRPSVILLASPNNPTGTAVDLDLIRELHAATDGIVVVDEAYAEFRRAGTDSAATLVPSHPRLVVTRTMSKAFAFAGARVGYAVAQIPVIEALRIVRLPYHLSAVTQVVARVALAHVEELQADVARLRTDRDALAEWLLWNGFDAPASDANFILFGPFADRRTVWQGLVDRGVLIREVGPEGWLRVTVGRPEEIAAFKAALLDVVDVMGRSGDADDAGDAEDAVPAAEATDAPSAAASATADGALAQAPGDSAVDGIPDAAARSEWSDPDQPPAEDEEPDSSERETATEVADAGLAGAGASLIESLADPAEAETSVETVGSRLQALRGEDVDATVFDGLGVPVDLPEHDAIRDVDADLADPNTHPANDDAAAVDAAAVEGAPVNDAAVGDAAVGEDAATAVGEDGSTATTDGILDGDHAAGESDSAGHPDSDGESDSDGEHGVDSDDGFLGDGGADSGGGSEDDGGADSDHSSEGVDVDEADKRAAEHDEEVALAVLRDRAEAAADQMAEQIMDSERGA